MTKRILTCVFAIAALLAMVACGGGGSSSTTTTNPGTQSAPITINIGDAAADRLLAFEVTVNSVTLTGSGGTTSNLLPAPVKVELTHLSGKFEPLRLMGIPAGSYTGATIQLGSAEAVILGAAGTTQAGQIIKQQNITPNPASITITFPQVTVGASASVLNFDFNLGTSVNVTANTVSFTPSPTSVTVIANRAGQVEDEQENEDGELEDIHGTVTALGTNTFTIALENNSQTLQFTVGDATQTSFSDGIASFADIKVGMVVKVEGVTRADGTLFAKEVEGVEIENGLETEGLITNTNITGGAGTITLVVHESASASTTQPATDDTINVNVNANTRFKAPDFGHGKTKIQDPQLPFDATHLGKGQKVEVDDDTARSNNLAARKLQLKKQALVGTVSNLSNSGFTLTLDSANSFFTQLTGETTIQVLTTSKTLVKGAAAANGQTIRVRGLLFFDNAKAVGQKYTMAAGRTDH